MASTRTDAELHRHAEAFHEALSDLVRTYVVGERSRIVCHDISLTQCYALEALVRRGPSTLTALAAQLGLDKSTTSRVVTALQQRGYVGRAVHPADARSVMLDVTRAGRQLHGRIRQDRVAERTALLASFPPAVREGIADVMRRVATATRERLAGAAESGRRSA